MLLEQWVVTLRQPEIVRGAREFYEQFGNVEVQFDFRHPLLGTEAAQLALLRLQHPVFAFPTTRAFLKETLATDTPSRILDGTRKIQNRMRELDVLGRYFSETETSTELARQFGFDISEFPRFRKNGIHNLWVFSAPEIKDKYLPEALPANRPSYWRLLDACLKRLRPKGPSLAMLLDQGVDPNQFVHHLGITREELTENELFLFSRNRRLQVFPRASLVSRAKLEG